MPDLKALLDVLPTGVVLVDASGAVVFASAASGLLGIRPETGQELFVACPALASLERSFRTSMAEGAGLDEQREITVGEAPALRDVRVRLIRVILGGTAWGLLVVEDDTRSRQSERMFDRLLKVAESQAIRDPLTGLFNRRHLEGVLPLVLGRAERFDVAVSLVMVDADHFKKVNDRFGHPTGDRVLVKLADLMQRVFRQGDTCVRLGGEEFCALLTRADEAQAMQAGDRMLRMVRALRFDETDLRVTVSIGVATSRPPFGDLDREGTLLLGRADEALYHAKSKGRDRIEVAHAG